MEEVPADEFEHASAAESGGHVDVTVEDVSAVLKRVEDTAISEESGLELLLNLALPDVVDKSPPLRLPGLPRFAASAAPLTSGPVHAMMLHSFVGLEHGPVAQWYGPPAVESPLRGPPASGDVVDDFGPCLRGRNFEAWMGAVRRLLLAVAHRLRDSSGSAGAVELPISTIVAAIAAIAPFCSYVPWSSPDVCQAAQQLLCTLAKATAAGSVGRGAVGGHGKSHRTAAASGVAAGEARQPCCLCSEAAGAGRVPLHPFLASPTSPFAAAAAGTAAAAALSLDRSSPLVEPHTCANALVAAFADELLAHVRARMRGSDWCARVSATASSSTSGSSSISSSSCTSRYVAHWVITSLRSPHWTAERIGAALPVLLKLCDRWEATNVWLGTSGLVHLFLHAPAAELRMHRGVVLEALGRCRSQKQPTAAAAVAYARAMALPVLFGPAPGLGAAGAAAATGAAGGSFSGPQGPMFRAVASSPVLAAALPGGSGEAVELLDTSLGGGASSVAAGGPYAHFITEAAQELVLATGTPGTALGQLAVLPLPIALLGERASAVAAALVPPLARILLESSDGRMVAAAAHVLAVLATAAPGGFRIAGHEAAEALAAVPTEATGGAPADASGATASLSASLDSLGTAAREAAVAAGSAAAVADTIHHRVPASPAQQRSAELRGRRDLVDQVLGGAAAAREQLLMGLAIAREADIAPLQLRATPSSAAAAAAPEIPAAASASASSTAMAMADVSAAAVLGVDGEDGSDGRLRRPLAAVLAVLERLVAAVAAAAPEYTAAAMAAMREHLAAALQV